PGREHAPAVAELLRVDRRVRRDLEDLRLEPHLKALHDRVQRDERRDAERDAGDRDQVEQLLVPELPEREEEDEPHRSAADTADVASAPGGAARGSRAARTRAPSESAAASPTTTWAPSGRPSTSA